MALNTLAYAQVLQKELDKKAEATLTSGWMDANAGQVIYHGGREIKVPKMSLTGLKDYDRDNGYKKGGVTLAYQTMDMKMDRGTSFLLDPMDIDETNFILSATTVAGEFQRTKVVPEVDAYRYSMIAALAKDYGTDYTADAATIWDALIDDIGIVRDKVGDSEPLVVIISSRVKTQLEKLKGFDKTIGVAEFTQGAVTTKVKTVNDCPLLSVPSDRMKTEYVFADGEADGQKNGGFSATAEAQTINWIVLPKRAPIAVCKQDKMKIIDPDTYQNADAWFMGYRKYHDLWIKESMLETVRVNRAPAVSV